MFCLLYSLACNPGQESLKRIIQISSENSGKTIDVENSETSLSRNRTLSNESRSISLISGIKQASWMSSG